MSQERSERGVRVFYWRLRVLPRPRGRSFQAAERAEREIFSRVEFLSSRRRSRESRSRTSAAVSREETIKIVVKVRLVGGRADFEQCRSRESRGYSGNRALSPSLGVVERPILVCWRTQSYDADRVLPFVFCSFLRISVVFSEWSFRNSLLPPYFGEGRNLGRPTCSDRF